MYWSEVDPEMLNATYSPKYADKGLDLLEDIPLQHLGFIRREMERKDNGWGATQQPCYRGHHEFDDWGSHSNASGYSRILGDIFRE